MSLRVVVLGDVPAALVEHLAQLPASFDLVVNERAADEAASRALLARAVPDIAIVGAAFSDRRSVFPFLRGLTAAQRPTGTIIVSERDEDAVEAFELQVTDFLLQPVAPARLEAALTRARHQVLQVALLRTADELQRLIGEASTVGGFDLQSIFSTSTASRAPGQLRNGNGNGHAVHGGANGNGHAASHEGASHGAARRSRVGAGATGTLIASTSWRAKRGEPLMAGVAAEPDEAVLDLSQESGRSSEGEGRPLRVLVREGRRTRFVPLHDVDWFEADGNYIVVHAGAERYRTRGTITAIENALDPRQFVRIHRRMVVNMDRVRELSPLPGGDGLLMLGNGSTLRLSRTYRSRVR